jgi:hypothetical protein
MVFFDNYHVRLPFKWTAIVTQLFCAFTVHIFSQPELGACIERMDYLYKHADNFEQTFLPFLICFLRMALVGGF